MKNVIIFLIYSIVCFYVIFLYDGTQYNFIAQFFSFTISLICLFFILIKPVNSYSLHQIVQVFFIFFVCLAPTVQYKNNVELWGTSNFSDSFYSMGVVFFGVVYLLFNSSYFFFKKQLNRKKNNTSTRSIYYVDKYILVLISVVAFVAFLITINFNILTLFFRGVSEDLESSRSQYTSTVVFLLSNVFLRPIPIVCLVIFKKYHNRSFFFEIILLLLVLMSNFPSALPRFQVAATYIPLLLVYFPFLARRSNLSQLFILGLLIVFPFMTQFRAFNNSISIKNLALNFDNFNEVDFDTFYNTINIVEKGYITFGEQLLGVVLFFVPRRFWSEKPVGSGNLISEVLNYNFNNVAISYFGEGYINFGYLGVFLFTVILAYFTSKFDWLYFNNLLSKEYYKIYFLFFLGLIFFMLRGDLLNSFAYSIGILFSIISVFKLSIKKSNQHKK